MIGSGVSKSGSPAAKLTMSLPASRRLLAKSLSIMVLDGCKFAILGLRVLATAALVGATAALHPDEEDLFSKGEFQCDYTQGMLK